MKLANLPPLEFVSTDVETLEAECKKIIEKNLGRKLAAADPLYLLLKSLLAIIINQRVLINISANRNLVAFADGIYLDRLGDLVGVERLPATAATCSVQIKISAPRETSTTIKKGTRITADNQIFFRLDEDVTFLAGEIEKDSTATCTELSETGNGYAAGELNLIVDPQPFLLSIKNTTTTDGGSDVEGDDSLRERIHLAPEAYSCAGSEGAYIFHAKSTSALISDAAVYSPVPGVVQVFILENDGAASDEIIRQVQNRLNKKTVRPLTDNVEVLQPTVITYDLNVDYYISPDNSAQVTQIKKAVQKAADEFILWQRERLGRDINPSKLVSMLIAAGAGRVEVLAPTFQSVDKFSVAVAGAVAVNYAGLEDD